MKHGILSKQYYTLSQSIQYFMSLIHYNQTVSALVLQRHNRCTNFTLIITRIGVQLDNNSVKCSDVF
jgi:hypothetical protein